ncbi:hypothetical protein Syun_011704 [Stephania yunnanensis]|uniref:Uncharacterized protein n=1 Tax=Stephania yunnanensis TaxID=152371 RepID=A0AAP0JYS5_9MAGN
MYVIGEFIDERGPLEEYHFMAIKTEPYHMYLLSDLPELLLRTKFEHLDKILSIDQNIHYNHKTIHN